jgi:hypothetical protein
MQSLGSAAQAIVFQLGRQLHVIVDLFLGHGVPTAYVTWLVRQSLITPDG